MKKIILKIAKIYMKMYSKDHRDCRTSFIGKRCAVKQLMYKEYNWS